MNNRKIIFEKIQNARDLGGLKNKEGKTIRNGLLLRTANLSETSENDLQKLLKEYHLAKVIDLRTEMEHDFTTGSVLWHCTEGKDRCGLLAVFLLSALGVEREVIVEDYLLTNETNVPKAEMIGRQLLAAGKPEKLVESIQNSFLAKESYLNAAFEVIEKQFGDMEAFLREGLGITEEMVVRFRERVFI